ncbi:MAG TPA: hypothetical protein VLA48_02630 [Nitrososphaeraceae archaeon]|nr:hypothetical protein [Nitrososphaeraceae archaeon]
MEKGLTILGGLVAVLLLVVVMAFPTMWAWNAFMPKVFGLIRIDFMDALWLNLLASALFKSTTSSSK